MSTIKERMTRPPEYRPHRPVPNPDDHVLVTEQVLNIQIQGLAKHLAPLIRAQQRPILMPIAEGGLVFGQDLAVALNQIDPDLEFDYVPIRYRSRRGVSDSSNQRPYLDEEDYPYPDVDGRNVIPIDDVGDSFHTVVVAEKEVRARGGKVNDVVVAVEKQSPDEFKGHIRTHHLPQNVRLHSLIQIGALWVFKYGMDNGNDATEKEDRAGREIRVNWEFERENHPGMVAELKRRFLEYISK